MNEELDELQARVKRLEKKANVSNKRWKDACIEKEAAGIEAYADQEEWSKANNRLLYYYSNGRPSPRKIDG